MMKRSVEVCDKCGDVMEPRSGDKLEPVTIRRKKWHLCYSCIDRLWDYLCNGGSGTPGPFGHGHDEQPGED
jgi:hypothetical protein